MFKRFLGLGAFFALILAPVAVHAAEKDAPTLIVRFQSVDKTMDLAEYVLGLAGQDGEQAKQIMSFAKLLINGEKGIEGVDTKRPFVVYATLAEAIAESQVVVMVPIADQEAFLDLLKKRANLKPEEKDGLYTVEVPMSPAPVCFRFANKYVYGTFQTNKDNIAEKKLPKPSEVAGSDSGVLSLSLRVDRFPEQMKKFGLGFIEQQLAELKKKPIPNETEAIKILKDKAIDSLVAGIKAVLFESKEVTLKLDIDPKKDEFALEFDLSAVDGSDLAKTFSNWKKGKTIVNSGLFGKSAIGLTLNVGLPQPVKKALEPVVDELVKLGLSMAQGEYQELLEPLVKAVTPTLKAAEFDGGFALFGPNSKDLYTYVQAGKLKDGLKIEKAVKDLVKKLPGAENFVKIDEESIGDIKVHIIKVPMIDENARKIFGESDACIAFRDDMIVVAFGPDYKDAIKAVLLGKPVEGPLVKFSVNGYKITPLLSASDPTAAKIAKEMFGKNPDAESFYVTIEAGNSLKVRVAVKGQMIKFGMAMDKAKKNRN